MKKMQKSIFKKMALACFMLLFGTQVFAQGRIELNPSSKGVRISESGFKGFNSTFSFNAVESENVKTEAGDFSRITIAKTVLGGELGGPSLPIARELVAVPFGATPTVKVVSYTTTDYNLSDYGIERVYPQQPSYSKSTKVEDMIFHYDEKAYTSSRILNDTPEVSIEVLGTMRGIQLGALQVEPVDYNPANNTIRVYNDIEIEVVFENADIALTEETLVKTYSPYFDVVYSQLFNTRAINDVYEDHPDLFAAPVRMIVIANRMFEEVMQPWLEWKTQKGFYIDLKYTDQIGETANDIQAYIQERYEIEAPSFVIVFGDEDQVAPSRNSGVESGRVTDLYYSSVDGDEYPDIYHSRMACETVDQMSALIHKILQVEQYTMPDPSYLNNVLLIAGADGTWNPRVGQPTIKYASNYYYNAENGFENVYEYLNSYSGCYSHFNTGVGFANYTAHGSETSWADPSFTVSSVNALTNTDKYFWAMGNCCNAADWGYNSTSFGEAMIRAEEKAAWGYIGACPVTYWWEDYYFGVGATNVTNQMPTMEQTTMGNYDALWMEDSYNVIAAVPFVGNLAVAYAHTAGGYSTSASVKYYFEAYHTLGDASVMPFKTEPTNNNVSHLPTLPIGLDYYTIEAAPGSYVGISQNGILYGAGMVGETGVEDIPMTPITSSGDVTIVVTHPERIPYVGVVPAASMDGPFIAVDSYTPNVVPTNEEIFMSVSLKNVGTETTDGAVTFVLSSENDHITIVDNEATFDALAADATVELTDEFSFIISEDAVDNEIIVINTLATCGSETWEGKISITVGAPILEFVGYSWAGYFEPGETYDVMAQFKNKGHYMAKNLVANLSTTNSNVTIENESVEAGTLDPEGIATVVFNVTVSSSCPTTESIDLAFEAVAENADAAQGTGLMQNTCEVIFSLKDSWGDGWNGADLTVTFDDGTPEQEMTVPSGSDSKTYELTINTGTHVTVNFNSGSYDSECSYIISYSDGTVICENQSTPVSGVVCEFDVNCGSGFAGDAVQDLTANTDQIGQVTLTWTAPNDAINFLVLRNGIQIAETTETSYLDTDLLSGSYTYSVIAVYEGGQSVPALIIVEVYDNVGEDYNVMFSVYPNPAKDHINVVTNAQTYEYQLINSIGQVVLNGTLNGNDQISLGGLNKGMYFLKVVADGETTINKVIIQ